MRLIKCRYRQPIDQTLVDALTKAAVEALE